MTLSNLSVKLTGIIHPNWKVDDIPLYCSVLVYFGHLHNYVLCIHPILPGVHTMIVPGTVVFD